MNKSLTNLIDWKRSKSGANENEQIAEEWHKTVTKKFEKSLCEI